MNEIEYIRIIIFFQSKLFLERNVSKYENVSLSNFDVMVEIAAKNGYIKEDKEKLIKFRNNPSDESWIK